MIHRMGYDGQCETCGKAIHWEAVDEAGACDECRTAYFKGQYAHWKPLYDAEKRAGLLDPEQAAQDIRDAGRGHLLRPDQ